MARLEKILVESDSTLTHRACLVTLTRQKWLGHITCYHFLHFPWTRVHSRFIFENTIGHFGIFSNSGKWIRIGDGYFLQIRWELWNYRHFDLIHRIRKLELFTVVVQIWLRAKWLHITLRMNDLLRYAWPTWTQYHQTNRSIYPLNVALSKLLSSQINCSSL